MEWGFPNHKCQKSCQITSRRRVIPHTHISSSQYSLIPSDFKIRTCKSGVEIFSWNYLVNSTIVQFSHPKIKAEKVVGLKLSLGWELLKAESFLRLKVSQGWKYLMDESLSAENVSQLKLSFGARTVNFLQLKVSRGWKCLRDPFGTKVFKVHKKLDKIHCVLPLSVVSSALLPFRPRRPRLSVIVAGTTAEPTGSRRHCCQYGRLCGLQRGAAATRPRAGAAHWASSWKRPEIREIQKTPCGYVWGILVCIQNPKLILYFCA